jgi:hypothetical protein
MVAVQVQSMLKEGWDVVYNCKLVVQQAAVVSAFVFIVMIFCLLSRAVFLVAPPEKLTTIQTIFRTAAGLTLSFWGGMLTKAALAVVKLEGCRQFGCQLLGPKFQTYMEQLITSARK